LFFLLKDTNEINKALGEYRKGFGSVGMFSAAVNLLALAPSVYMLQVYDRVLTGQNVTTLVMLTIMIIGLLVLSALMEVARSHILVRISNQFDMKLNGKIYDSAFRQNLATGASRSGQAVRDLSTVRQFFTGHGVLALFDTPWIPVYMAVLFLLHPALCLLAVVGAAISCFLAFMGERYTGKPMAQANRLASKSTERLDANMRNAEVIEAMGMLRTLRTLWRREHLDFLKLQSEASDKGACWSHASKYFRIFLQSAALGLGAYLVLDQQMTPGMMIAGSILVSRALQPIDLLLNVFKSFANTKVAYERLVELLKVRGVETEKMTLPAPVPRVSFDGVSSGPPGVKRPTLLNVSFEIPAGTVLGVIGPSGAGKSTLIRTLAGIWLPKIGKVSLDGADLNQWDREQLGPHIGYLPQGIELFAGTVSENIARFKADATDEQVINAAMMAGVHEMILELPEGYKTQLGPGGVGLSGGQCQRIALARAVFGNPSLLILDEPNSNLDDRGEAALVQTIHKQRELGNTVVVASHRPSLLSATNALLLLKDGKVVNFGTTQRVLGDLRKANEQARTKASHE